MLTMLSLTRNMNQYTIYEIKLCDYVSILILTKIVGLVETNLKANLGNFMLNLQTKRQKFTCDIRISSNFIFKLQMS